MNVNDLFRTAAREEAIGTYARAYDRHIWAKRDAMARHDHRKAEEENAAAYWAKLAYERESFNPLPDGLP